MSQNNTSTIGNIDLSVLRKKRFTINNDESKILELDTSDLLIVKRLSDAYPKLDALGLKTTKVADGVSEDDSDLAGDLVLMGNNLAQIDAEMRELVDFIFDADVCGVCAEHGSMYDMIDGQFRYEHIIAALMGLYEGNLKKEAARIQKRVKSHTAKYTG